MTQHARALFSIVTAILFLPASPAPAQFEDELGSGLVAEYVGAKESRCLRVDRRLSFNWNSESPDARIAAGRFSATWRGLLLSHEPGEYRFYFYAQGKVALTLGDEKVLHGDLKEPGWLVSGPIELPHRFHPLRAEFEQTSGKARISLFWSGPGFGLEPPTRRLFYDLENEPPRLYERGRELARALRCAACHEMGDETPLAAPSLAHVAGNLQPGWTAAWLTDDASVDDDDSLARRRMPHFAIGEADAGALTAYLFQQSKPAPPQRQPRGDAENGRKLLLTLGCLACHSAGELGQEGLFGGGDLTKIAAKRPAGFFERWLEAPESVNPRHRMPVFDLSAQERRDLSAHLATLGKPSEHKLAADEATIARGKKLYEHHRCGSCHENAAGGPKPAKVALSKPPRWEVACVVSAVDKKEDRPAYLLSESDAQSVAHYVEARLAAEGQSTSQLAALLLAENNCLACHARGDGGGLADGVARTAATHPELAGLVPAMTPPPLVSVGDKLHDEALADAIRRRGEVHRPWLAVRMPKFQLSDDELAAIVDHFVAADRIPDRPNGKPPTRFSQKLMRTAGGPLVTTDGFGCTSCHSVGKSEPPDAPLAAKGPDLSLLGNRIRKSWYDRWVRNPARIVPNMEMPSYQLSVHGLLDDDLSTQLDAVWTVLNTPDFNPPPPSIVRIVRKGNKPDQQERATVLTDVIRVGDQTFIKPLVIALPSRHSLLFDLATARLAAWWTGDCARQRTEGKSWYWEAAGEQLMPVADDGESDWSIIPAGGEMPTAPLRAGQFIAELQEVRHFGAAIGFQYELAFPGDSGGEKVSFNVSEGFWGDLRLLNFSAAAKGCQIRLRVWPLPLPEKAIDDTDLKWITIRAGDATIAVQKQAGLDIESDRAGVYAVVPLNDAGAGALIVRYGSRTETGSFDAPAPVIQPPPATPLNVVPGYDAVRLPLVSEFMPTGLAWRRDGTLVVSSLKGRVWLLDDADGDGLEDRQRVFSDELAAPYGVATGTGLSDIEGAEVEREFIDVINKYALLRLVDDDEDGRADRMINIASGWGHTADYHDWAIGLPRDKQGNYYVALPCQQDDRSEAAAKWRGKVLKLVPPESKSTDPYQGYRIEQLTSGHRFPMGIALDRAGEIFVTDNQGNYNPFNELNHAVPGRSYGFINSLEQKERDFTPPELAPPAIDIPHPWTRSVNGICFLDTPEKVREETGGDLFGPFEGHLIGCEYDTRRLVRMSLQEIDGEFQGAAYPFSYEAPQDGPPLLGPICCAVAPDGDLYIGSIRDSGWGGSNNIGEIARLRPSKEGPPAGIAEVRATPEGFEIEFTRAVDRERASDKKSYRISSYTRTSTPAYGGKDEELRTEKIAATEVSADGLRAVLTLGEPLREQFVYEIHVENLSVGGGEFFPAEAHYTLRRRP